MAGGQRHRTVCAGLAETCDRVDASYICGYRRCHDRLCHSRRDCRIIAIPAFFSASFHVFFVARLRFSDQKTSRATFNRVKYPLTGIFRAKTALRGVFGVARLENNRQKSKSCDVLRHLIAKIRWDATRAPSDDRRNTTSSGQDSPACPTRTPDAPDAPDSR